MTMFIKIENNIPVSYAITEENFRYLFPNQFSDPYVFKPSDVEPLGYGMYEFTQIPMAEYPNKAVEITPVKRENGIYYQNWSIQEMNDEEKQEATAIKAMHVRSERNFKLMQSDRTQLLDSSLTEEQRLAWATYRQQLRDLPTLQGFPWEFTWPDEPVFS